MLIKPLIFSHVSPFRLIFPGSYKFQLRFMSLTPQRKGTFIKIECIKTKPCLCQRKMGRVRGSNLT